MAKAPVFVPAAEEEAKEAQLKKEADEAHKAAGADHKALASAPKPSRQATQARCILTTLGSEKGRRAWDSADMERRQVHYLRGQFHETPALYELKDGKGSLIKYDFANGLYTIPKTLTRGYLSIGKQRVDFRQIKAGS